MFASAVEFDARTREACHWAAPCRCSKTRPTATIADVSAPAYAAQFKPHDKATLNAGYSRSVFWLKVDLHYLPKTRGPTHLAAGAGLPAAGPPRPVPARCHRQLSPGRAHRRRLPFASREIRQNNYLFKLTCAQPTGNPLPAPAQGSIQAPLTLWSAPLPGRTTAPVCAGDDLRRAAGMLVYNLFIYLSVRDTSYLYYILYIASFGLYQLSVNGAAEYFWPDNPWWANAATPFFIGSAALFGSLFARSFLHTAQHSRWIDRLLLALVACGRW
jgi:hypothetical protein